MCGFVVILKYNGGAVDTSTLSIMSNTWCTAARTMNKYIFRESMRDRIPDVVQQRVDKMGFPVGMPDLLRGKSREAVLDILGSRGARERGIYDTRRILDDIDGRRVEDTALAYDAFRIAQFELWSNLYGV